jgi:hypothetical protein
MTRWFSALTRTATMLSAAARPTECRIEVTGSDID